MSTQTRDPLRGMALHLRQDFDKQPRVVREAYIDWWNSRENTAAAHRDTWPAFLGGWRARTLATRAKVA